jgi:hypothetical protein
VKRTTDIITNTKSHIFDSLTKREMVRMIKRKLTSLAIETQNIFSLSDEIRAVHPVIDC